MIILTVRTDNPEAEIGLYSDARQIDYVQWTAHRQLAETIHVRLRDLLARNNLPLTALEGIVCYKGPGSFTGLRIGLSVVNALADALGVPVYGATGDEWIVLGIKRLPTAKAGSLVIPEYGADVHITLPKH